MPIPMPSPWRGGGLNWLVQRFPSSLSDLAACSDPEGSGPSADPSSAVALLRRVEGYGPQAGP
jgi:hypothetical protein